MKYLLTKHDYAKAAGITDKIDFEIPQQYVDSFNRWVAVNCLDCIFGWIYDNNDCYGRPLPWLEVIRKINERGEIHFDQKD